jgi:Superinfection immunity protein
VDDADGLTFGAQFEAPSRIFTNGSNTRPMKRSLLAAAIALAATPALAASSDGGDPVGVLLIIAATFSGYFLPSMIASSRKHHQTLAIFLLNLLLGWTVLGWIGALVWAATAVQQPPATPHHRVW